MITISAHGLTALQRGFKKAPDFTRQELLVAMFAATALLHREAADAMPAVSGLTRASITRDAFSTAAGVLGVVGSASIAAVAVELGTKPHMPPVEPLEAWVNEKLGLAGKEARSAAFAIARKIARQGTKAQRPFGNTWAKQAATVSRIFEGAASNVAARLAGDVNGAPQ